MTARNPLPDSIAHTGFLSRDAPVPRSRLRAADLDRTVRGTRVATDRPLDLPQRCRQLALRMPRGHWFSHETAARLHGLPLPPGRDEATAHVTVLAPARAPHALGVRGHSQTVRAEELRKLVGLTVTTPIRTWLDLGTRLGLADLVAVGDHLLHHRLVTWEQLRAALAMRADRRGRGLLHRALGLLNDRSESPQESILRVLLHEAGLPAPLVNVDVRDSMGRFVARPDLRFEKWGIALEYLGDYHRTDPAQWRREGSRRADLASHGVRVLEVFAPDLLAPDELIAKVLRLARAPRS